MAFHMRLDRLDSGWAIRALGSDDESILDGRHSERH